MDIEWVEELPKRTTQVDPTFTREVVSLQTELRKQAGEWARVAKATTSGNFLATKLRNQMGSTYEVHVRSVGFNSTGKRIYDVYARRLPLSVPTKP